MSVLRYLFERVKEPSTWFGLFAILSAFFGIDIEPDKKEALMWFAISMAGGGAVLSKDSGSN